MPRDAHRKLLGTLRRDEPRQITPRRHAQITAEDRAFVESWDRSTFDSYESWLDRYGRAGFKRDEILRRMISENVPEGNMLAMARVRAEDPSRHAMLLRYLRYRWTNYREHMIEQINADEDQIWRRMAMGIQKRSASRGKAIDPAWEGDKGLESLTWYLKALWDQQSGLCALSGVTMVLKLGHDDLAVPDRRDNDLGYVRGNIWLATKWANGLKMDQDLNTFLDRVAMVHQHNIARR